MVDLSKLTPEQKAELTAAALEEEKQKEAAKRSEREQYKSLVDETVHNWITKLQELSGSLAEVKKEVYGDLTTLVETKKELYSVKETQLSHTFTTTDGNARIVLGSKKITGWDGTQDAGVEKVKAYITNLASNPEHRALVDMIFNLLKPDKQGNLDIKRVMELYQMREKIEDEGFREGVDIIKEAYAPRASAIGIEVQVRVGDSKEWKYVPLSISAVNI